MKPPVFTARLTLLAIAGAFAMNALGDEELDANRALWMAAELSDYEFRYQKVCECHRETPADTIVIVRDGEIVQVRYDREDYLNEIVVPAKNYQWFRTVDDLFSLVAGAQARNALVRVSYHPTLGYPERIYVDYDQNLVGEEVELHVFELGEIT